MNHSLKTLAIATSLAMCLTMPVSHASIVENHDLKLVGEGKMSYLFWDVYLARFYTSTGDYQFGVTPLALEFNYLLDIEAQDLVEETIKQWREQNFAVHPDEQQWAKQLNEIWPDVSEGDQLLFLVDQQYHAHFYHNQKYLGSINSKDFSERFKAIWLSDKTTAPKVRKKLLGE